MGAPAGGPGWAKWVGLQQQLAGEKSRIFQAVLEQLTSTQQQANGNPSRVQIPGQKTPAEVPFNPPPGCRR